MKALIYTGPEKVIYTDASDPDPQPEEALVRVDSVGICGSDMHAFLGHDERRPAPLILGHEAAGVVVQGKIEGKRVTFNQVVQGSSPCQPTNKIKYLAVTGSPKALRK